MKTTLDIPEALLRRVKARAAQRGASMRDFFVEAVEEKLSLDGAKAATVHGWRSVFGKAPKGATAEVQAIIDGALETVNPEEWR
jgi:hypothetical protein